MLIVTLTLLLIQYCWLKGSFKQYARQKSNSPEYLKTMKTYKSQKKPDWVLQEVLRLKAHLPQASCRTLAYIFNRQFEHKAQSVGKTFVGCTIRNHLYDIQLLRKQIKNKPPNQVAYNRYWGMDITFVDNKPVLGVIEHHSRKLLGLIPISSKSSLNIIKQLVRLFRYSKKPRIIRTDNKICFNSKLIKLFLTLAGIKHQTIEKHCPWQNGRIERLFGTFKSTLNGLPIKPEELPLLCYDFQQWYNVIRPHQSLKGKTPEDVYWTQVRKRYRQ